MLRHGLVEELRALLESGDTKYDDRTLTVAEVAALLGKSPQTVRDYIHRGTLPAQQSPPPIFNVHPSRREWRILLGDVRAMYEREH